MAGIGEGAVLATDCVVDGNTKPRYIYIEAYQALS